MRPRAVIVHPPFGPFGGGELLAAWFLEALARDYALTLVCIEPVDWARVDARFGTTLVSAGITVRTPSPTWRRVLRRWPHRADRIRRALLERLSAHLAAADAGDVWISTCNEMRLPQRGLQYVHFPTPGMLADEDLDRLGWTLSAQARYQALCRRLSGAQLVDHRQNLTLVNSHFTAEAWRHLHGQPAEVVYPPVPPLQGGRPWSERLDRAVCLGRLFPGKGLEQVVRIISGARERGAAVTLAVAGQWDCRPAERRQLEQLLRGQPWIELYENPSRAMLAELVATSRYGVHGMVHEPFGIAVAELQDTGAITFAPIDGGPREIIEDERLLYRDEADGIDKFVRVWRSPEMQDELRHRAAMRVGRFSPARFMADVRAKVQAFAG